MYGLYTTYLVPGGARYNLIERVSLFGCRVGYIPWMLNEHIPQGQGEPFSWKINVRTELDRLDLANHTLIIDLKPNSSARNVSLYEIADVWGVSANGWTPIMFRLRGLFMDQSDASLDDRDFVRHSDEIEENIFSMMYLNGTVQNGSIFGPWTPPGPSATNSVLLWPDTMDYFSSEARKFY